MVAGKTSKPGPLAGERVAFTGRFATLTRPRARQFVQDLGGEFHASVTPRTTMLVVGVRGWPLLKTGSITRNLAEAERLRDHGVRIVSEDEFRERAGLVPETPTTDKALTLEQVADAVQQPPDAVRRWEQLGLVRSHGGKFDFRDLVSLRTITGLVARGVAPTRIRKSLEALGKHLPGVDRPLSQLQILITESGGLVAELEEALLRPDGQLEINFDAKPWDTDGPHALRHDRSAATEALIDEGVEFEERGDLARAEAAYRRAAESAPADATAHFNLGNVLLALGKPEAAAERFGLAASLDPSHARAWFNLAHAQDELGKLSAARESLQRAIKADPAFADAHFNLADISQRLGDADAARSTFAAYLRLDPAGEWADEARRRLAQLRGPAWA